MNETNLPPLPPVGVAGPSACAAIRLYIAVLSDLSPEQMRLVAAHIQTCRSCALEYEVAVRATQMVASLESTAPSAHVDKAVLAVIAARRRHVTMQRPSEPARPLVLNRARQRRSGRLVGLAAMAAAILVAAFFSARFFLPGSTAFALPANLSWDGYVIHHVQMLTSSQGEAYQIEAYHDMATDHVKVTTTAMDSKTQAMVMQVVVMQDEKTKQMLGMDEMNKVAQWQPPDSWSVDDSMFDVAALRHDLQDKHAVYQGKDVFQGQPVYRIGWSDGTALLLNMQYQPVNVLKGAKGLGTGKAMYAKFELLQPSAQLKAMWSMDIPAHFSMGSLPDHP